MALPGPMASMLVGERSSWCSSENAPRTEVRPASRLCSFGGLSRELVGGVNATVEWGVGTVNGMKRADV